jgi:hypothetical protein
MQAYICSANHFCSSVSRRYFGLPNPVRQSFSAAIAYYLILIGLQPFRQGSVAIFVLCGFSASELNMFIFCLNSTL